MSKVAFLTPHFNRDDLFPETLASMKAQTHTDWECWLVDDGSTDESYSRIENMCSDEPRVNVLKRNRDPKGACTCRNIGLKLTDAQYVISLDTDDIIEPFCLEQRVRAMEENPALDFAIFPSLMFESTPNDLGLWWNVDTGEDLLVRQFRHDAICQGTGAIWTTEAFRRIGEWSESLALWQDIDLFFRAYIQGYRYQKFFELPPDLHNRCNHASLSRHDFFNRAKQESRVQVVESAVQLLESNDMFEQRSLARYMVGEIVFGNASARNFDLADSMIEFAQDHSIVSRKEIRILRRIVMLFRLRLYRVPGVKRMLADLSRTFETQSYLGRVPVGRESEYIGTPEIIAT